MEFQNIFFFKRFFKKQNLGGESPKIVKGRVQSGAYCHDEPMERNAQCSIWNLDEERDSSFIMRVGESSAKTPRYSNKHFCVDGLFTRP